jgi:hypothetical protein
MAPAGMQNMHSSAHTHRGRKRTCAARLNSITHSAIQPAAASEASVKARLASMRRPFPGGQADAVPGVGGDGGAIYSVTIL